MREPILRGRQSVQSMIFAGALAVLGVFASSTPVARAGDPVLVNGAGATFPYPLYSKWFRAYRSVDPGSEFNYQSIGSGGGIRQLLDKTIDFGASDAPMTDEQLAKSSLPIHHFPMVLGAVVLTYNLPGVKGSLKLTPELVSDLFLGRITQWNDGKIAKENPGVKLPDLPVFVAYRSDGSGTTAIFTDYLSKVSAGWKAKVGSGPAVKWPTGLGGKGNEGVTGLVKQTPGALGYVELIYAVSNKLAFAALKNASGKFVEPSPASVTAAAGSLKSIPEDFRVSITNAAGEGAYPIAGFSYLLAYGKMPKVKQAAFTKFLDWALGAGQKEAEPMGYAPLPKEIVPKVKAQIAKIQGV